MSTVRLRAGMVKARKIHHSDGSCYFDEYMIEVNGKKVIKPRELEWLKMLPEEVYLIEQAYVNNWKIQPGEMYYSFTGVCDGELFTAALPAGICEILNKYDLFFDD